MLNLSNGQGNIFKCWFVLSSIYPFNHLGRFVDYLGITKNLGRIWCRWNALILVCGAMNNLAHVLIYELFTIFIMGFREVQYVNSLA